MTIFIHRTPQLFLTQSGVVPQLYVPGRFFTLLLATMPPPLTSSVAPVECFLIHDGMSLPKTTYQELMIRVRREAAETQPPGMCLRRRKTMIIHHYGRICWDCTIASLSCENHMGETVHNFYIMLAGVGCRRRVIINAAGLPMLPSGMLHLLCLQQQGHRRPLHQ